jgi:tetrahydromethanopterin S-methyltransferase subunit E
VNGIRRRFRIEAGLSGLTFGLTVLTIFWHDWIEIVFGTDPDHGNGAVEWLIVAALALVAIILGARARIDLRRLRAAAA